MGLFDNIKLAADLVKGGIAAFKAVEKLDKLAERSRDEYKSLVNADEERLYKAYLNAKDAYEKEEDTDKKNELTEKVEAAEVAYLMAVGEDASFPAAFRSEIAAAIAEYRKTNSDEAMMGVVDKWIMRQAKTDEEKEAARQILDEARADMNAEK